MRCSRLAAAVSAIWLATLAGASAHVKWFCPYNVAEAPRPLVLLLQPDFFYLIAVAVLVFLVAGLIDRLFIGRAIVWSIDRVTSPLRPLVPAILRATFGGFFVAIWTHGGIILTPELLTSVNAISWLQLLIAACFIWERTLVIAAVGIFGLYGYGLSKYGLFHMLDYPIFLGGALYFAMTGLQFRPWGIAPLDVVRIGAGITLMWASVEKWGYPQWTYPLFALHPEMAMGFSVPFYMKSAGVVEFSLAFAMLGTPLMRRTAAILLASTFTTAIFEFGKIDAIGHSAIIAVLVAVAADNRQGKRQSPLVAPAGYIVSLAVVTGAYYGIHAALFAKG